MVLPLILLCLGIVVILYALRKQNSMEEDLMTALKGLVHLKKEITRVEDDLYDIKKTVKESSAENQGAKSNPQAVTIEPKKTDEKETTVTQPVFGYAQQYQQTENTVLYIEREKQVRKESQRTALPDKYQRVLMMNRQGYPEKEIAQDLGLSQDAVNLILRTHVKGESV